jgi:phytoene dehydrogenase-like protein
LGQHPTYDYVVVGAGHNGLVAASILASNGAEVLVVEARPTPGGEASGGVAGGSWYPRVAYALGLMPPRLAGLLGVSLGDAALWPEPSWVVVVDGGEWLRWWRSRERLVEELREHGVPPGRAREALSFFEGFARCAGEEGVLYTVDPPSLGEAAEALERCMPGLGELVEKPWESWAPHLLTPELADALIYPVFKWEPGFVGLYFNMSLGVWGLPRRGFTILAGQLEAAARGRGAEILYGARVRLWYSRGRVRGVELPGGRRVEARRGVLLAASIACLPRLAPPEALDEHLSRGERRELEGLAAADLSIDRVNIALDSPPSPPTGRRPAPIVAVEQEGVSGEAVYPTLNEPPPPGSPHVVSFSGASTLGLEELARTLAGEGPRILWADVVDRGVLDAEYCNPNGNPNLVPMTRRHLLDSRPLPGWGAYRTPIPGLYHAAASSHPGGQVTGIPGHNAAVRALLDAGVKPERHLIPPRLLGEPGGGGWP